MRAIGRLMRTSVQLIDPHPLRLLYQAARRPPTRLPPPRARRGAVTAMVSRSFSVSAPTVGCGTVEAIRRSTYDRCRAAWRKSLIDEELVKRGVRMMAYRQRESAWM